MSNLIDDKALLAGCELFDGAWYLREYPDVAELGMDPLEHYLRFGARLGRDPGPRFDTSRYLETYRDVARKGLNPLVHYVRFGRQEGRKALGAAAEARPLAPALPFMPLDRPETGTGWLAMVDRLKRANAQVAIVVPIYNAPAEVDKCIASVVRHTRVRARLILIDDASTDPAIATVLQRWQGWPGIEIHRNPENLGYTRTVNRGVDLAGEDDVVLLNSDTEVAAGWLEGLRLAAYSRESVGTATPVSNNAGAFSVTDPATDPYPAWFDTDDCARLVRQSSPSMLPWMPTGNGFCLYLRRDCLRAVGKFDEAAFPRGYGEENDFCLRAQRAGFDNVIDDRTFVYHRRSASFGEARAQLAAAGAQVLRERYPEYPRLTPQFGSDPDLQLLRSRVAAALTQARGLRVTPLPRVLFVISTVTGGTPQTNRDLMEALADRYEPWVLRCDSKSLHLWNLASPEGTPVESIGLRRPLAAARHDSEEYADCLASLLVRYGFELVHIRHIAWHGLSLPAVCRGLGIPVVFSFHDFYTICPTVKLLDEKLSFCGGRCTATEGECGAELWPTASMPPLKHRFIQRWQQMMAEALAHCDAYVTTTQSARKTVLEVFPQLADKPFPVIAHGRSFARMEQLAAAPARGEKIRLLVPGNINAAKGAEIVKELARIAPEVEIHVLGNASGRLRAGGNLILHGPYQREDFPKLVASIKPHAGAIFSIWPETYSHTLTEMWACGLPVVAFDIGAVGERLVAQGGGWPLRLGTTAAELRELLSALPERREEWQAKVAEVAAWQATVGRHYDTKAMAVEYDLLYRSVADRRRAFGHRLVEAEREPRVVLFTTPRTPRSTPASTHIRVLERVRNSVARPLLFREVAPDYPFGEARCGRADLVLIQRDAIKGDGVDAAMAACRERGLPWVVELDDDLLAVPADKDPDGSYAAAREPLRRLLAEAALVSVSTGTLRERLAGSARRIEVVPNMLSARVWADPEVPRPDNARAQVLYMGTVTHSEDLEMIRPAIEELVAAGLIDFHVIGGQRPEAAWFQRIPIPGHVKNYPDFVPWFRHVARGFDLALAPLRDTAFNAGKSDLKLLDYAAAGLPCIASRTPSYAALSDIAVLVENTTDAWREAIRQLASHAAPRIDLATRAQAFVQSARMYRKPWHGYDDLLLTASFAAPQRQSSEGASA